MPPTMAPRSPVNILLHHKYSKYVRVSHVTSAAKVTIWVLCRTFALRTVKSVKFAQQRGDRFFGARLFPEREGSPIPNQKEAFSERSDQKPSGDKTF